MAVPHPMTGDVGPSGDAGLPGRPGLPGVSGAEVARRFYGEAVAPVLARKFPRLRYAAARLGSGSDVLGLDDAMSRDHDWGCRLTLLVDSADATAVPLVHEQLERSLPASWRGQPVRFATTWDASVSHQVEVAAVGDFARSRLGIDPLAGLTVVDWLMLTGQSVLEVTAGPVFTDQTSELGRVRERLRWYPDGVDRYVLAAGWQQVSHRLPMHGRAAGRGDDAGSRVIAATIVADLMRLALLAHRRWPPYEKWLGTAVRALPGGRPLAAALSAAVTGPGWREREAAIVTASAQIAEGQRDRTGPGPEPLFIQFWDRPYRDVNPVLIEGLRAGITDHELARLPHDVGSVDQWVNDVEVLARPARSALAATYRLWLSGT